MSKQLTNINFYASILLVILPHKINRTKLKNKTMKRTFKSTFGTSFLGDTILTSINDLKKIGIFPVCEQNSGNNKTNFDFDLETEKGEPFTIYDWKLYRPIGLDEKISFHIGAFTKEASERAKSELIEALQTI